MTYDNGKGKDLSGTNLMDSNCFKEPVKSYKELVGSAHERIGSNAMDFRSFIANVHEDIISEMHEILRQKLKS